MTSKYEAIYAAVRRIPRGKVATYGQIAKVAGLGNHARLVGYALAALERDDVPWHRVINAKGEVSLRHGAEVQRDKLRCEGVRVDVHGRIPMDEFRWPHCM